MNWWERQEWSSERGDVQAPPDSSGINAGDLSNADTAVAEMQRTPLGEPKTEYDVRSIYDSRPVNAYDFNFSQVVNSTFGTLGTSFLITFQTPTGYRAVPKEWDVQLSPPYTGNVPATTQLFLQQGGLDLLNNGPIEIGMGTFFPIKSFFICEEQTTFGVRGTTNLIGSVAQPITVKVWGTLIAVSDAALPFSIANKRL